MAISVKSKFAGLLRGLLRQMDSPETPRPVTAAVPPAHSAASPVAPTVSTAKTTPATTAATALAENEIDIPLASVVNGLPMELRAKLMSAPSPNATIRLTADTVISQLGFGAVKISFGELRQLAPGLFANSGGEHDNRPVSLPLQEILSRVNPALLNRRQVKKVEVADEIAGPFGERGRGVAFTTNPLKAPIAPANLTPHLPPPVTAPEPSVPITFKSREITPAPATPARALTPTPNGNGHTDLFPLPPGLKLTPPTNGQGSHHGSNSVPNSPLTPYGLKITATPAFAATPIVPEAPAAPTIFTTLADLSENWPAELRNEIMRSPLANVSVPLPGDIIEPGLKRGRVAMSWKQLRTLAQPSSAPSPNDHLELELPLKIIAPMFLAAKKNVSRPQAKVAVTSDIPDLFFGFPQPTAPAPAAVVPPLPKSQDTNFYVWGEKGEAPQLDEAGLRRGENPQTDFLSRQAHPKEVVARAAALPGVAGAVVALPDGLRVASQVPTELNADTLAAFLPQIFERVNQSTRELRMGTLNNVCFTVGNVPWKIFRVNSVYFAAFGRAGEGLPTAQLAQLAIELDRKKSQL